MDRLRFCLNDRWIERSDLPPTTTLLRFLRDRCGLPREIVQADAAGIAAAMNSRFPGDWSKLAEHLNQAADARYQSLAPRSALALVKALDHDLKTLIERTT